MVPRIASRGGSFQGAGMYYLHDKQANTSDRVAWTETHNLPTNDPDKAIKWMAYTAMSADELKRSSGVKPTGRKAQKGSVYSYSLAWHPDQDPDEAHMKIQAKETLKLLGLEDHESIVVAHQETDHDHIHVIVNLVHPESGKTAKLYKDHIKLSEWAQEYEISTNQIYCQDRIDNNLKRKEAQHKSDTEAQPTSEFVKYREKKVSQSDLVRSLYERSDSGKAFKDALERHKLTLAKGDRRGFVLVDEKGKVFSLSRQLKGQRASDIKARLSDIKELGFAKSLSIERMRLSTNVYSDKNIALTFPSNRKEENEMTISNMDVRLSAIQSNLLLKRIEYDRSANRRIQEKEEELDDFYGVKLLQAKIKALQTEINKIENKKISIFKNTKDLQERLKRTLDDLKQVKWRKGEQMDKVRLEIEKKRPEKYDEKKWKKHLSNENVQPTPVNVKKQKRNDNKHGYDPR